MSEIILIVDPQRDFIDGSLPAPGAPEAMNALADYIAKNNGKYAAKIVTCDYHPYGHCSFVENGGKWPRHCVAATPGASIWPILARQLHETDGEVIQLYKGKKIDKDQYSIFEDEASAQTIANTVRNLDATKIDICGLVGDVCVLNTLKDGIKALGRERFRPLAEFTPSLDGGLAFGEFCQKVFQCDRL